MPYRDIGAVINDVADQHKLGVVREYVGHGVGRAFHSAPTINHFRNNSSGVMKLGQTFTIEPMIVQVCAAGALFAMLLGWPPEPIVYICSYLIPLACITVQGSIKCKTWADKWTVVTEDGGLCAQYEHTLLITQDGVEIMTKLA